MSHSFDHSIDILGAGISAPGLDGWNSFLKALDGEALDPDKALRPSSLLSPRERRRAPAAVKLTFAAAEEACQQAGISPAEPLAIFSSGMGDLDITDYLCRTLADQPELLSPTRFHNSVLNAASGYWSIGAGARGDVTALSAWRDSATIGLIEAVTRARLGRQPVLLVVYDDKAVGPMQDLWPSQWGFCAAMVLAGPDNDRQPLARLKVSHARGEDQFQPLPDSLEARRSDNPAARILPLLALIAACHDDCYDKRDDNGSDNRSGNRASQPVLLGAEQGPGLRFERVPA